MLGSYIGCEYWSVDLDQYDDPSGDPINADYGVVVSNPGDETVTLSFEVGTGDPVNIADPSVPPGEARQFVLPALNDDGTMGEIDWYSFQDALEDPYAYGDGAYYYGDGAYGDGDGYGDGRALSIAEVLVEVTEVGRPGLKVDFVCWPGKVPDA